MGTYRKEWDCCDSVSETSGWEPDTCPFCKPLNLSAEIKNPNDEFQIGDQVVESIHWGTCTVIGKYSSRLISEGYCIENNFTGHVKAVSVIALTKAS